MSAIGAALARLHSTTIIHGDLTTSNMMVRLTPDATEPYEIVSLTSSSHTFCLLCPQCHLIGGLMKNLLQVLIDFGLSSTAQFPEHYAVDLYVLERAFASTHPASEDLYAGVTSPVSAKTPRLITKQVLEAYGQGLGEKKWKPIEQKLKEGE
jgi:TP53 regulating kinase-like protein